MFPFSKNGDEQPTTHHLSDGSTKFTVDILCIFQYVHGKKDIDDFHGDNLNMLKIENSIFTVKYDGVYANQWLKIECKFFDQEDEIEFSECILSTQRNENSPVIEEPIGYKFKFNKKTKYEFRYHYIHLKHDDNSKKELQIRVYALIITFPGYTKKYCFHNDELDPISAYFTGTTLFDDFEIYGGTLSNESDPSVPIQIDKTDGDISDEMDGDTSNETNGDISAKKNGDASDEMKGDTSDEVNADLSDQINQKKGFWTTKNILVIVLSFVAVVFSILLAAIILRYRKSQRSTNA
ncbi:hypothetical protein RF11_06014 [Thelohanellus kitauei]|uniref:Uncharacterized protein n=1 Tax=Thelohanellus kitauei TaxID=669202 RepID=A0A0C2JMZ7_THEKT|nr:hypothetical protein RF11_06014 [Thelohanellus kitauei]